MVLKNVYPKKIYLDTSVFIAEFDKKDARHKILTDFLKQIEKAKDVQLCYSKWAIAEMYNRLTKNQIMELRIAKYVKDLLDKNKLRTLNLRPLGVCSNKNYNFNDFFNSLSKDLIKYKTGKERPGLGDIIHIRIMKNNRINTILTFDSHFDEIQDIISLNLSKTKNEIEAGVKNE
jgi:predicted nucleic acid-binding protein